MSVVRGCTVIKTDVETARVISDERLQFRARNCLIPRREAVWPDGTCTVGGGKWSVVKGDIGSQDLLNDDVVGPGQAEAGVMGVDPGVAVHMTAVLGDVARRRRQMWQAIADLKDEFDNDVVDPGYMGRLEGIQRSAKEDVKEMIRKVGNSHTQMRTAGSWEQRKLEAHRRNDTSRGKGNGSWYYELGLEALKGSAKALHGTPLEDALDYLENAFAEHWSSCSVFMNKSQRAAKWRFQTRVNDQHYHSLLALYLLGMIDKKIFLEEGTALLIKTPSKRRRRRRRKGREHRELRRFAVGKGGYAPPIVAMGEGYGETPKSGRPAVSQDVSTR